MEFNSLLLSIIEHGLETRMKQGYNIPEYEIVERTFPGRSTTLKYLECGIGDIKLRKDIFVNENNTPDEVIEFAIECAEYIISMSSLIDLGDRGLKILKLASEFNIYPKGYHIDETDVYMNLTSAFRLFNMRVYPGGVVIRFIVKYGYHSFDKLFQIDDRFSVEETVELIKEATRGLEEYIESVTYI